MRISKVSFISEGQALLFKTNRETVIKNAAVGFGVGAFYGLSRGSMPEVALFGCAGALSIGVVKTHSDYRTAALCQRERFEKQLNRWMHHVVLMLASGAHPLTAVRKSAEVCREEVQFALMCESLMRLGDLYQSLTRLSSYAQVLEVQRFNARLLLFENQGNSTLLELMADDLSAYDQRLVEKAQMKIEKSILRQALPSLLIFATIMVHMMYPLLLGGIL